MNTFGKIVREKISLDLFKMITKVNNIVFIRKNLYVRIYYFNVLVLTRLYN